MRKFFGYVIFEELGLISSNIRGEKNIIPYEEIESVHVVPYMSYSRRNTNFVWEIIFQVRNQNKEVYQYIDINKSNLERTFQIKGIVTGKGIPFEVREMNADTLEWFDWELEMDNLDKERYYELFEINDNKTTNITYVRNMKHVKLANNQMQ